MPKKDAPLSAAKLFKGNRSPYINAAMVNNEKDFIKSRLIILYVTIVNNDTLVKLKFKLRRLKIACY